MSCSEPNLADALADVVGRLDRVEALLTKLVESGAGPDRYADPATGEQLPPMLTYREFCARWPMKIGALRKRVASGWVRVQRTSHRHVHITRAEFIRLRRAHEQQAGDTPPARKRGRRG